MKNVMERTAEIDVDKRIADFNVKMAMPYEFKKNYAYQRAWEFYNEATDKGYNVHVSIGGLDSITLYLFLHSIGIYAEGVTVSLLEDISIQKVHKALKLTRLVPSTNPDTGKPYKKPEIIQKFGFPVLSKEIATKIEFLQNPSDNNKTTRHAIITGETGEYGGYRTNSRMKMSQKWLNKFGGYENESEGVNYATPNFKVSSKCCEYLKERPCDDWAKKNHSVPYLGLMASEGGRRAKGLKINGCNYFGKSETRSAPFAIFSHSDLLRLALEMDEYYKAERVKKGWGEIESIIPTIYGEIIEKNGELVTTGASRTGCSMCGFGIHLEKSPNRFEIMKERNYKEWDYYMHHICKDEDGTEYGWARVCEYIGVPCGEENNGTNGV